MGPIYAKPNWVTTWAPTTLDSAVLASWHVVPRPNKYFGESCQQIGHTCNVLIGSVSHPLRLRALHYPCIQPLEGLDPETHGPHHTSRLSDHAPPCQVLYSLDHHANGRRKGSMSSDRSTASRCACTEWNERCIYIKRRSICNDNPTHPSRSTVFRRTRSGISSPWKALRYVPLRRKLTRPLH